MNVLIIESKGKVEKIQGFLGAGWRVVATLGHIRDLPVKRFGVSSDMKPEYELTERGVGIAKRLKAAVSGNDVYIATDPDREGEAIAWHVAQVLKLSKVKRCAFTEVTESAVKAAIASPRDLDMNLVRAQEARRVLDRACGYLVSRPLQRVVGEKLSAGRVQTPATRLLVERERERTAFSSVTHYGVRLHFESVENITDGWRADLVTSSVLADGQEYLQDKDLAEVLAACRSLEVLDCKTTTSRQGPPAPFTTSTLMQAAASLNLNANQVREISQRLYDAGLVTYIRTDSPAMAPEAIEAIRVYCSEQNWPCVAKSRIFKAKDSAQGAHECIRPTHIKVEEAGETPEERALYRLIRLRALATQLEDAEYSTVVLSLGSEHEGRPVRFDARGRVMRSPGWRIVYGAEVLDESEEDAQAASNPVPAMKIGTRATALSGEVTTQKTSPPSRYSEAKLIRELEKRGIGRPSTYAMIMETIKQRGYAKIEKNNLVPTALGECLIATMEGKFCFADYEYTGQMERQLDEIAAGQLTYNAVVAPAYALIDSEVQNFQKANGKVCPKCGKAMSKRKGKKGFFFGCEGYPDCKETLDAA